MGGVDDPRPSYRQVADQLRTAIEDGRFAVGSQLPTQKALAAEHGVAVETVKRALSELRAAGLIASRQGKGSYVRSQSGDAGGPMPRPPELLDAVEHLRRELDDVKERLAALESHLRVPAERST